MIIVVLGGGIDYSGQLPPHVLSRLTNAMRLYWENPGSQIVLSSKYSFLFPKENPPPKTEAKAMFEYLTGSGIPPADLLLEEMSQDTISNAYYLKTLIFLPHNWFDATIITSRFHIERVRFIFQKVFGPQYHFQYLATEEDMPKEEEEKVITHQQELLMKTSQFLAPMSDGQQEFLADKFYSAPYYTEKRPDWVTHFVAEGSYKK